MTIRPLNRDDPLDDFQRRTISLLGHDRLVYTMGSGPAVIVMTEMPGISPHVARFARWVRDAGFTVYMPHIFGRFYRGEARTANGKLIDPRGLGQGLFIAQKVSEAHGGYLKAQSQSGQGSIFTMVLPTM